MAAATIFFSTVCAPLLVPAYIAGAGAFGGGLSVWGMNAAKGDGHKGGRHKGGGH
jgi:hypothetical protein